MKRLTTMMSTAVILAALAVGTIMPTTAIAKPLKTDDFPIGVTESLPKGLIEDLPDGARVDYVYAGDINTGRGIVAVDIEFPASTSKNDLGIGDAFTRIRDAEDVAAKPIGPDSGLDDVITAGVFYAHPYPDGEDSVGFAVIQDNHILFIVQKGWMLIDEGADADMIATYATSVMRDGLEQTPLPPGPGWKMLETSYADRENEGWK